MKPSELFTAIANAIRAKDSTSDPIPAITFPERIMGLSGGGGGENGWAIVPPVKVRATAAEVFGGKYYTHMLFNGVRLPRVPFGKDTYRYVFIMQNTSSGYYEMYLSTQANYHSSSRIKYPGGVSRKRYRIAIARAETATEWESISTSYSDVIISDTNILLWSSHDLPDGSATATDIYFESTDPVPVD